MQQHRRVLQTPFTKSKVSNYLSLQLEETRKVVKGMMKNPLEWETELRRYAIAIVANVAYGEEITSINHPWVKLSDDAAYATGHAGTPVGLSHFSL
jgi:cytochrome P450